NTDLFSPAVSIDSAGGYFAGWIEDLSVAVESEAIDNFIAYVQAFGASDQPVDDEFIVASASDDRADPQDFHLAAMNDGSGAIFALAFYNFNSDSLTDEVLYGRTTTSDRLDQPARVLNDTQWSDTFFAVSAGQ